MRDLILGRHYFKKNPEGDKSLWKPGAHLDPAKRQDLNKIRWGHFLQNVRFAGVYSSGLARADETAYDLTHCKPTSAIELNPLAIYGDYAWREFCVTAEGREMSVAETMNAWPTQTAAMGMLGANFLRRKMAEIEDGETILAITHQPLIEFIFTTLMSHKGSFLTVFKEGDLMQISFNEKNEVEDHHFMSAAAAMAPKSLPPSLDN